jgi:putative ABC transport system ATP-binding protein
MNEQHQAIAIRDLEFRWRADAPPTLIIDELSVRRGERLFIEGPSGSGKSTLLSLLGGVTTPQKGTVEVLGVGLQALSAARRDHFRADRIGFVFQMFNLLPYLSMVENVTLPCRFSKRRRERVEIQGQTLEGEARRLLSHLDLADEALLSRPVTELSVGQQQRVAVARALIGAPELVIADEPTSALDADRRESFLQLLERECSEQGITLLFVSHDASLEPLFDRTVALAELNRAGR